MQSKQYLLAILYLQEHLRDIRHHYTIYDVCDQIVVGINLVGIHKMSAANDKKYITAELDGKKITNHSNKEYYTIRILDINCFVCYVILLLVEQCNEIVFLNSH